MRPVLYLIRHCSSPSQHADSPLTAEGEAQALLLAERLGDVPFARIVSSPYARAIASVAPLAKRAGVSLAVDERLAEFRLSDDPNLADWQTHLRASFAGGDIALPGGESASTATARARAAVDHALEGAIGPVAIATHGRLLSLLLNLTFEGWRALTNPDVYRIDPDGRVERIAMAS